MNYSRLLWAALLAGAAGTALAAEVVNDDLVVRNSLCVGSDCEATEEFGFDTIRLKTDDPVLRFQDTSSIEDFPTNDWLMGIVSDGPDATPRFYIHDVDAGADVMRLEAGEDGGVALGAGAATEPGAVSVGAPGGERRIANVADGVEPTDALTVGQLEAFTDTVTDDLAVNAERKAALDARLDTLEQDLEALVTRLDALLASGNP